MKKLPLFFSILLAAGFAVQASAESRLCMKKTASVKNGKVTLSKILKTSSTTCPKGTVEVYKEPATIDTLTNLQSIDGTGSGLDADTLDGLHKDSFALASDLTTATSSISSDETRISDLESETRINNVVRVASAGGDYTSLATAISSLTNPSVNNPYLIIMGPGTFTTASTLAIPGGVTVRGAGMNRTIISGSENSNSLNSAAVISMQNGSMIEDLTIENTSTAASLSSIALYIGAGVDSGHANIGNIDTIVKGVRLKMVGSGAVIHYGAFIGSSDVVIRNSIVDVDGSTNTQYGIYNLNSSNTVIHIYDSNIYSGSTASTSKAYYGTDTGSSQTLYVINTKIYGHFSGIHLSGAGITAKIMNSLISTNTGTGTALTATNATMVVNSTTIDSFTNATSSGTGSITCAFITELSGGGYASTCS